MVFREKPVFVKMANTLPGKRSSGDLAMENILIAPQVIYWLCGADAVGDELDGHCFLSWLYPPNSFPAAFGGAPAPLPPKTMGRFSGASV